MLYEREGANGYYYDTETSLYYLQTRYYDPEICRFMTIDGVEYVESDPTCGRNLYAYCGNNPVMYIDPTGHFFLACIIVGMIAGAIIVGTASGVAAAQNGASGWEIFGNVLLGMGIGVLLGAVIGLGVGLIGAGISSIGGALAGVGGEIFSLGAVGAGSVVVGGAIVVSGGRLFVDALGVNVMFSRNPDNDFPMQGEPNSIRAKGESYGYYDNHGNLVARKDLGHMHNGQKPHIHKFKWWVWKCIWRWMPY